jgi:hypothetical protein
MDGDSPPVAATCGDTTSDTDGIVNDPIFFYFSLLPVMFWYIILVHLLYEHVYTQTLNGTSNSSPPEDEDCPPATVEALKIVGRHPELAPNTNGAGAREPDSRWTASVRNQRILWARHVNAEPAECLFPIPASSKPYDVLVDLNDPTFLRLAHVSYHGIVRKWTSSRGRRTRSLSPDRVVVPFPPTAAAFAGAHSPKYKPIFGLRSANLDGITVPRQVLSNESRTLQGYACDAQAYATYMAWLSGHPEDEWVAHTATTFYQAARAADRMRFTQQEQENLRERHPSFPSAEALRNPMVAKTYQSEYELATATGKFSTILKHASLAADNLAHLHWQRVAEVTPRRPVTDDPKSTVERVEDLVAARRLDNSLHLDAVLAMSSNLEMFLDHLELAEATLNGLREDQDLPRLEPNANPDASRDSIRCKQQQEVMLEDRDLSRPINMQYPNKYGRYDTSTARPTRSTHARDWRQVPKVKEVGRHYCQDLEHRHTNRDDRDRCERAFLLHVRTLEDQAWYLDLPFDYSNPGKKYVNNNVRYRHAHPSSATKLDIMDGLARDVLVNTVPVRDPCIRPPAEFRQFLESEAKPKTKI